MEFLTTRVSSLSPSLTPSRNYDDSSKTIFLPFGLSQNSISILKASSQFISCQNRPSLHQTTTLLNSLHDSIPSLKFHLSLLKIASFRNITNTHFRDPLHNHLSAVKIDSLLKITTTHLSIPLQNHFSTFKTALFLKIPPSHLSNPLQNHLSMIKTVPFFDNPGAYFSNLFQNHLLLFKASSLLPLLAFLSQSPSVAAETAISTEQQLPNKINIESILVSIDDFFNRYPFFVASVTFVWLVVIPLIEEYLKKFKYISALNAFRKLKDDPNSQLLDIRSKQSLAYIGSPNLKILQKAAIQVEFSEGKEEGFLKEVSKNFSDPGNTIICVLDNFNGDSLKVAELLVKNGFKEAYAIKEGLRGKDGWQDIQENFLPPSVHVYPTKKGKASRQFDVSRGKLDSSIGDNGNIPSSQNVNQVADRVVENASMKPADTAPKANQSLERPLSPYPKYPDLKPPSSPTPSKPQS